MSDSGKYKITVAGACRELLNLTVGVLPQDEQLLRDAVANVPGLDPERYLFEVLCLKFFVSFTAMRATIPQPLGTKFLDEWDKVTRDFSPVAPERIRAIAVRGGFGDVHGALLRRTSAYVRACDEGPRWSALDITGRTFARFCSANPHQKELWRIAHFYYNTRRNELLAFLKSCQYLDAVSI